MAAAITIIPTRWYAAATASCRWTSMFRAARPPPRRCCTAFCCCRRRFGAPGPSSGDEMTSETMESLGQAIAGALPGAVAGYVTTHGELTLAVNAADIVRVATFLRDDPRCAFFCFIDVTAADLPSRGWRFHVGFHRRSPPKNKRVRLPIGVGDAPPVPSPVGGVPGRCP